MVKFAHILLLAAAILPGFSVRETPVPVVMTQAPWRALLRVQTELGGRCTGFLIAPAVAITAAHCLFAPRTGRWLQPGSVHVLLRYQRGRYDAHARVRRFVIPPAYDPRSEAASAGSDRAILLLDHPIAAPGDVLAVGRLLPPVGTVLRLAGYGQDRDEVAVAGPVCHIVGMHTDGSGGVVLAHDCIGTLGTSGAPLMTRGAGGVWRAVGVQIEARIGGAGGLAAGLAAPEEGSTPSGRSSDR